MVLLELKKPVQQLKDEKEEAANKANIEIIKCDNFQDFQDLGEELKKRFFSQGNGKLIKSI